MPLAKHVASDVSYYLPDHLGSVGGTVRSDGQMTSCHLYRPYGEKLMTDVYPSGKTKFGYTGQQLDEDLPHELYYYGSRYYDPALKVFLSVDPAAQSYPSWSPYSYCQANPVKYTDPNGEVVETAVDVVSVGLSAYDFYKDPSWANGGWLALDIVCAAVPFLPAVGAVRHAGKIDDIIDAGKALLKSDEAVDVARAADKTADAVKATDATADAAGTGKKIHGNSLDSPKENTLYRLETEEGDLLKWGVTSAEPIQRRYPQKYLKRKRMTPVGNGSRRDMIAAERRLVETQAGPLNLEPWAHRQ